MAIEALSEAGAMILIVALFGVVFTGRSRWPWIVLATLGLLAMGAAAAGGVP